MVGRLCAIWAGKYKEGKLREDPTWTLEKEMCMRRGAL
jgi:hypothetical protein